MENRKIAEEIIRQLQLFSLSGAYGVLLGIWYEFFRILRKTFVHKNRIGESANKTNTLALMSR